jgi:hypothetical protein
MNDRTFTTAGLLVFFALVVVVASRCEPSAAAPRHEALRMAEPSASNRGRLRGMVDPPAPAAEMQVTVDAVDAPPDLRVTTRSATVLADGRYEFNDLPAGTWRIRVLRRGAVLQTAELVVPGGAEVVWPR